MMKLICVSAMLLASAAAYEKDGDVLVLGDSDLADAIKENEFLLVEFYAPWCGHCKQLEPEYAKAATELAALDKPINIAKVDATVHSASGEEYGVQGYPTIKWFVSGEVSDYEGGRTGPEIVSWIKKKTGPPCTILADADAVAKFKESGVAVIAFLETGTDDFAALESVARVADDVSFGVATGLGGDEEGKIVLYKDFDELKNVFEGAVTKEALTDFVASNSVPLVSTFTQETAGSIFGSGIDNHFLYFSAPDADGHEDRMAELKAAAGEYKGKTLCVFVPAEEERVLEYFDFTAEDLPKAVLVSLGEGDMKKFTFDKDITAANIKSHIAAFHAGELKPTLKSEEEPAEQGPVTVLVGTTFDKIVLDETKDVLVEFYAPWCGHCKALTPVFDELGEKYASNDNIVIAKIDATANDVDHPKVSVKGFPTIMWFPKGGKDPVDYEGGRDLESFVAFVDEHAGVAAAADAAEDGKDEL